MSEQANKRLDILKDCTIALMSTSALLLILVFGFIVQRIPQQPNGSIDLAAFGFYSTIGFSVLELFFVVYFAGKKKKDVYWKGIYLPGVFFFLSVLTFVFGMSNIYSAILG